MKHTTQELERQKFRMLFYKSNDAVLVIKDWKIIEFNEKAATLFLCDEEQMQGLDAKTFIPKIQWNGQKSKDFFEEYVTAVHQSPTKSSIREVNYQDLNRVQIISEVNLGLIRFNDQDYYQAVIRDITQRKKDEAALKTSEAEFKGLFNNAPNAMMIIRDRKVYRCNSACEQLFGYTEAELKRIQYADIAEIKDVEDYKKNAIALLRGEIKSFSIERRYKRKNGTFFFGKAYVSSFVDRLEGEKDLILQITDITFEKTAVLALAESEAEFKGLFKYAPNATFIIRDDRLYKINEACEKMFGYTLEELQDKGETRITHPDYLYSHLRLENDLLQGKINNFTLEKKYIRKNGEVFPGRLYMSLIKGQKEGKKDFIIQIMDISEEKETEEVIMRHVDALENTNRQLERTNNELDQFAYVVSHDLKAPLRGISTLADFIQEDCISGNTEEVSDNLKLLKNRIARMSNLISGILEVSRAGKDEEQKVLIDLNLFLKETIDLIAPPAHVTINLPNNLPVLNTVKIRLQQIFQNLISNAIKYNDKEKCMVDINCVSQDSFYEFTVKDNGPGIAPEYQEKIFEVFQTLQPRDRIESTGVGLSIVRKQVQSFGGEVYVQSEMGVSTSFIFTIEK